MPTAEIATRQGNREEIPLASRILLYLYLNPSAKDTLEGIAQWWVREPATEVRKVMDVLVDLKIVKKVRSGRSTLYMAGEKPLKPFIDDARLWGSK